ncbi:hypothetical protein [Catenuloplanes atrovinosus]|uniref:Uncharacterized protein n=1 Tax=Catenuloplanes atrovinosus TaxID=137266 RepID=A0AAE3YSG2_9ACTN|nr:hypothetical protein [Catenuloplanes atrovinosus]MDR7279128.1 hypothetical protein [Catenuloplanes atrovinosus]
MSDQHAFRGDGPDEVAQRATDRLATSLEAVGFDVGEDFPQLSSVSTFGYGPPVRVGRISTETASRLCDVLARVPPAEEAATE